MGQYGGIIGGVAGAVIGSFVPGLGTAAGWALGSALGGAYSASQQVIPGPKIGEIQMQTAQEGGPRPIVFGRSHPIAGNVIADGKPRIVRRRERQGKGGPKVESESVYRTYALAFCEGPITAFLQVWRNNVLVYDAEDPSMAAENATFLKYARFYLGSWDQMPSPDLEAVLGAGNVHAHRGTAYMVLADEDCTDQRGMWSQWKVRVFRGTAKSYTTPPYPVYWEDGLSASLGRPRGATTSWTVENMIATVTPLGGQVRDVKLLYDMEPESLDAALTPLGGEVRGVKLYYDMEFESLEVVGCTPLGGGLQTVVLHYKNWPRESLNATLKPLGGALS